MNLLLETFVILGLSTKYFYCLYRPPPINVHLKDHETFVISSDRDNYADDENENEMIQPEDVADIKLLAEDEQKYQPLHSHVKYYNKLMTRTATVHSDIPYRFFPEDRSKFEEEKPFIADFKDRLDRYNFQATTNRLRRDDNKPLPSANVNIKKSIKEIEPIEEAYDYQRFKNEYYQLVEKSKSGNGTSNDTTTEKPEEPVKDALKEVLDFKKPKNCTKAEASQYGIKAFECLYYDYKRARNPNERKKVLLQAWRIIRLWLLIYICIAVPLWCHKGWCCCCCRCKFCFPRKRIRQSKKFFIQNPPGVFIEVGKDKKAVLKNYTPTIFEEQAYDKLEAAIKNL